MTKKKVTIAWAGFSDGKLDTWVDETHLSIFTTKRVAKERFTDVRKVKIIEVK